ncbi:MAG: hypothetical protein Q9183_005813, partial [Haloplaca sp. 2 TL-2023]
PPLLLVSFVVHSMHVGESVGERTRDFVFNVRTLAFILTLPAANLVVFTSFNLFAAILVCFAICSISGSLVSFHLFVFHYDSSHSSLLTRFLLYLQCLSSALSTSPNPAVTAHNALLKRAEPSTGDDDFPDTEPHPNKLDQVETVLNDAFELGAYVLNKIDDDIDIFPHYFNGGDRAGVKNVFLAIFGTTTIPENPSTGNDLPANIHVQREDTEEQCENEGTLAYMHDGETEKPTIVLCDNAFKKKVVTLLKGADP